MPTLKANKRTEIGTRKARVLRESGKVPGVMYGHGEGTEEISLETHDIELALHHGERLLEIDLEGNIQNCLIKDVQWDVFGTHLLHVDLTRVNLDEEVNVFVPIELVGTPEGVKEGGVLQQPMTELEMIATVRNLPEGIRHLVTELQIDDKVFVRDLELPEGARLANEEDLEEQVCNVSMLAEEEPLEGEEAEPGPDEPEVIGAKPEEEGDEAEE